MSNLLRILDLAKDMDAHDARQARDIIDARLRELEPTHGLISKDEYWKRASPGEGAELQARPFALIRKPSEMQAGLEEAVRRQTERVDSHEHDWLPTENLNWLICGTCEETTHTY